jgi:hypothetical protein
MSRLITSRSTTSRSIKEGNPMQEMIDRGLSEEQRMMRFKIVKAMFPSTAGIFAGPEN